MAEPVRFAIGSTALVAGVGELDICELCISSPHTVGCPRHSRFDDERFSYFRVDAPGEVGPASFWVRDTFAAAALGSGLNDRAALLEGMEEFSAALHRGELQALLAATSRFT
jgi:hypothetical protein